VVDDVLVGGARGSVGGGGWGVGGGGWGVGGGGWGVGGGGWTWKTPSRRAPGRRASLTSPPPLPPPPPPGPLRDGTLRGGRDTAVLPHEEALKLHRQRLLGLAKGAEFRGQAVEVGGGCTLLTAGSRMRWALLCVHGPRSQTVYVESASLELHRPRQGVRLARGIAGPGRRRHGTTGFTRRRRRRRRCAWQRNRGRQHDWRRGWQHDRCGRGTQVSARSSCELG
jgi:hypothetical protein